MHKSFHYHTWHVRASKKGWLYQGRRYAYALEIYGAEVYFSSKEEAVAYIDNHENEFPVNFCHLNYGRYSDGFNDALVFIRMINEDGWDEALSKFPLKPILNADPLKDNLRKVKQIWESLTC